MPKNLILFIFSLSLSLFNPAYSGTPHIREIYLQNGLKIIVKPDSRYPIAVFQVYYRVGSGKENKQLNGISHLLEHLMFKPTQHDPQGKIYQSLNQVGAQGNAFTSRDYSFYYHLLAKQHIELAFQLEAQRMQFLNFSEYDFQLEKRIVLAEQQSRLSDDPYIASYDKLYWHAFTSPSYTNPYALPVIGVPETIQSLQLDQANSWYQQFYRPDNAIIVIVGDVTATKMFQLAKKYFSPLVNPPFPAQKNFNRQATLALPSAKIKKRHLLSGSLKVGMLLQAYPVPVIKTAQPLWQAYALDVLAGWLDSGMNSRLSRTLVQKEKVASQVTVIYSPLMAKKSLLIIEAIPAKGISLAHLEQSLNRELRTIHTELISSSELQQIKNQINATAIYEQDSLLTQAKIIGQAEAVGIPWSEDALYLARINSISAQQIQQVVQQYIRPEFKTTIIQTAAKDE